MHLFASTVKRSKQYSRPWENFTGLTKKKKLT